MRPARREHCVLRLDDVLYASQRYQIGLRSHVSLSSARRRRRIVARVHEFSRGGEIVGRLKHFGQLLDRNRQDMMITGRTTIGGNPKRCVGRTVAKTSACKVSNGMSGNVAQTGEPESRLLKNLQSETHRSVGADDVKQRILLT